MKLNKELLGFKIEIIGLITLLFGSFWQANFSGWWDQQIPQWRYYAQSQVDQAILASIRKLADLEATDNKDLKIEISKTITNMTIDAEIEYKKEIAKINHTSDKGQAATFWNVRKFLVFTGAILIILGKYFSMAGVKSRLKSEESNS